MKLIRNTFLIILSFSMLSFTNVLFEEEEIEYEIISQGTNSNLNFSEQNYFTIENIFEYDEFWIHLTGNTTNKPYVDLHKSKLIVFGGESNIDKITITNEFINIYTTKKESNQNDYGQWIGYSTPYRLIKIPYNSSPVKWYEQVLENVEAK